MPFELIDEEKNPSKGKFELIDEKPSRARSLVSAPIKGGIKGALDIASIADPIKALLGVNELTPIQQQVLEKVLPTQKKPLERGLERAGKIGVSAIGGPESLLAKGTRTALGSILGQFAEEVGAPEGIQNLAELLAFTSPKFGKKILPKKSQKEAVQFLREKGLTDKEIAPLIQSERKIKALAPFTEKGEKTKKIISDISGKLGENYEILKDKYKNLAHPNLKGDAVVAFDNKLEDVLEKINPRFHRLIGSDLEALRNKGVSGENLINFYQDINAAVKGHEGGKAVLGKLKGPILDGLKEIDPNLAKDFKKLNEFYAKKGLLAKKLKPGTLDNLISKGKAYAALGSIASGSFGFLKGILSKDAIGRLSRELLINPRLQNLSNQMLESIEKNQVPVALRTYNVFKKELSKKDPELSEQLESLPQSPSNPE